MNNPLQTFNYEDAKIRVITLDGQPWWVAKDICGILGVGNVVQALTRLDDDERDTIILNDGTPGNPNTAIVNETGVYSLILSSRKPEAKAFKRWITHEVIPQIRQTGEYKIQPQKPVSLEDLIIMQAQSVKELKVKVEAIGVKSEYAAEQAESAHRRINELDAINPDGTPRQQLIKKINRYAEKNGLLYASAWSKFREAYNISYRTNIKALVNNYKKRNFISKMTIPEYLEATGKLQDGLRVADKMLNPARDFAII